MPQISVVVPVYKVEQYLHRCVDSILAQTFSDFELILVDDGSPDDSGAICDDYAAKDARVRVIHKQNGGLSDARNAGIEAALGDYLFFMDSDDVIHPDCLRILTDCIRQTGASIAGGEFARFSAEAPTEAHTDVWDGQYSCHSGEETLGMYFEERDSLHSVVSACCKLFGRDLFEDVRFPVGRLFEDEFTVYKLYYKADAVVFTTMVLYYYFVNNDGITGTLTLQKYFDEYDAQWERLEFFGEHGLNALQDQAWMAFLKTAKWHLIACRERRESADENRCRRFEEQYETAFVTARKRRLLDFLRDYDYYVLAKPRYRFWWRLRRFCCLLFTKRTQPQ